MTTLQLELSEGETKDCSAFATSGTNVGYGFKASCWRDWDTSDKRMHIYITKPTMGCRSKDKCDNNDDNVYDVCNFASPTL